MPDKEKRMGKLHQIQNLLRLSVSAGYRRLFAAPGRRRAHSQCKKRSDNRQCPQQQESIGVGASSCVQYADKRWSRETTDIRDHGHQSYPGGRRRPGQELSRRRPKRP